MIHKESNSGERSCAAVKNGLKRVFAICLLCAFISAMTGCSENSDSNNITAISLPDETAGSDANLPEETDSQKIQPLPSATSEPQQPATEEKAPENMQTEPPAFNKETETSASGTEMQENESAPDIFEGEYCDYDNNEPNLEIKRNEDGSYLIQIGIFRLIGIYDGHGVLVDNAIHFTSEELETETTGAAAEVKGKITLDNDIATVEFDGGWFEGQSVTTYKYYKTSDTPNISNIRA